MQIAATSIRPQTPGSAKPAEPPQPVVATSPPAPEPSDAAVDRVELSAAARPDHLPAALSALDERCQEVRAQIEAGVYITPDKLDAVVEALHAELFGE